MATNFPTSLDSFINPLNTDFLNSVTVPHIAQHGNANDSIAALEAKVGINGSAVTTSLDFLLKSAVDPGHTHSIYQLTTAATSCRLAATGNLAGTYNNGTAGVGATLTNNGTQAALSVDGVTVLVGDVLLLPLQTTKAQCGLWVVTTVGTVSTNWVLTRATNCNSASNILCGLQTHVQEGTLYASTIWQMSTATEVTPITVGTTSIIWTLQSLGCGVSISATTTQTTFTALSPSGTSTPILINLGQTAGQTLGHDLARIQAGYPISGVYTAAAQILFTSAETQNTTNKGCGINFSVTPTGNGPTLQTALQITSQGAIVLNPNFTGSAGAVDGFVYLPVITGPPTGTPTTLSGRAVCLDNTTFRRLWIHNGITTPAWGAPTQMITPTPSVTSAITNTTTPTAFSSQAQKTLAANAFQGGTFLTLWAAGVYGTDTAAPTLQIQVLLGSTVVADTGTITPLTGSLTNAGWNLQLKMGCYTNGSSGTLDVQGALTLATSTSASIVSLLSNSTTKTIDTTTTQTITIKVTWGTASTSNTITCRQFAIMLDN